MNGGDKMSRKLVATFAINEKTAREFRKDIGADDWSMGELFEELMRDYDEKSFSGLTLADWRILDDDDTEEKTTSKFVEYLMTDETNLVGKMVIGEYLRTLTNDACLARFRATREQIEALIPEIGRYLEQLCEKDIWAKCLFESAIAETILKCRRNSALKRIYHL